MQDFKLLSKKWLCLTTKDKQIIVQVLSRNKIIDVCIFFYIIGIFNQNKNYSVPWERTILSYNNERSIVKSLSTWLRIAISLISSTLPSLHSCFRRKLNQWRRLMWVKEKHKTLWVYSYTYCYYYFFFLTFSLEELQTYRKIAGIE